MSGLLFFYAACRIFVINIIGIMKKFLLFVSILYVSVMAFAGDEKLSPATKIWMKQHENVSRNLDSKSVEVFVSYQSPEVLSKLTSIGGKVNGVFDGFSTVSLPSNKIQDATDINGVNLIDVSHNVHLLTDSVANSTGTRMVNEGIGLQSSFTGKGVILGIIDCGIDFNHRAFLDLDLRNRIKRVYMPHVDSGNPVEGLPGSQYSGDEISSLRCDANGSHGTHTTGIAGGSIVGPYRGMAPDAELVVCALGDELSEVNVVNSALYIAQYAAREGKPCVINMSLGNHDGPHDGNGFMARAFDEISQKYQNVIFVLSAGNEGGTRLYLHKSICSDRKLSTMLSNSTSEVDAWSDKSKPFSIQLHLYDSYDETIVYSTDILKADTVITSETNEFFTKASNAGKITISFGKNDISGHTHIFLSSDLNLKNQYKLGLTYQSTDEIDLRVWECTGISSFQSYNIDGFTSGTDECSVSDMATGRYTISVGAYVNRNYHTSYQGVSVRDSQYPIGTISSFSSFGEDVNGNMHPFITAPGTAVVSSVNSHLSVHSNYAQVVADANGRNCYWGSMSGTSMSAPCVAGIVALWQEANPHLTVDQIKNVMALSANRKNITKDIWWGNGKIDAYQGIMQILSSRVDENGLSSNDIHMFVNDNLMTLVSASNDAISATIYSVNGKQVASFKGSNSIDFCLSNLDDGVYFVSACCAGRRQFFKVLKH